MDISVIIPIFNEEDNISPLFSELNGVLAKIGKSSEIIFVNDGSNDKSLDTMKKLRKDGDNIRIIDLKRNFGQTPAIMAGFDCAKGDIIITMDGDLQNDPADISAMIAKIKEGYDLVSGWRQKRKDNLLMRVIPSRIANWLISKMLKTPLHDYGCTLKAYKQNIVKNLKLYGEMHRFIPAIANMHGARIAEIKVHHRPRQHGKTKYGINRAGKVMLDLLLLVFLSEYGTKPIRFFGGVGLISSLMGVLSLFLLILMKITKNIDMTGNPLLILSVLFFLVSIQLISLGFLGEINMRTYYESQDKKTYHINELIG